MKKKGTGHNKQLHRLNRIEGQVRGLSKMIEEERYCVDILTQVRAVKAALSSVEASIIEEHLNHCIHKAITGKKQSQVTEMFKEINTLLRKSL